MTTVFAPHEDDADKDVAVARQERTDVHKHAAAGESGPREGRVHEVADTLGRRITGGVYSPGEALPTEPELASALGVGRNAVREAVKMLAGKGLLRTSRRAGTIVQPLSQWSILDNSVIAWLLENPGDRERLLDELAEMRAIIEPEAAALAAKRAKMSQVLRLWEALEAMETRPEVSEAALDADIEFHRVIFEAADSRLLLGMFHAIELLLRVNFATGMLAGSAFAENLAHHRRLAEAVQRRDADAARRLIQELAARNREDVKRARLMDSEAADH
nr:FCD domain-containing protein [Rhodovibrio salinarum]